MKTQTFVGQRNMNVAFWKLLFILITLVFTFNCSDTLEEKVREQYKTECLEAAIQSAQEYINQISNEGEWFLMDKVEIESYKADKRGLQYIIQTQLGVANKEKKEVRVLFETYYIEAGRKSFLLRKAIGVKDSTWYRFELEPTFSVAPLKD